MADEAEEARFSPCNRRNLTQMGLGAFLFVAYYTIFCLVWNGYIDRVWNLEMLSGIAIAELPIEELLFAAAFGAYWSGVYEHFTWRQLSAESQGHARCRADQADRFEEGETVS